MSFWTDSTLQDPKRKFRFRVMLSAYPNSATWYAKSVSKPSFEIGGTTHVFLNQMLLLIRWRLYKMLVMSSPVALLT